MNSPTRTDGPAAPSFAQSPLWFGVFLVLLAGQFWMTLALFAPPDAQRTVDSSSPRIPLFAPDSAWRRLTNEEPIISGWHPLHLYFGYLGAQSFRERGTLCCYDPSFQAGFPKTPVFDSGSRPAELFLSLSGARFRPSAYKVGVAICSCSVPFLVALAAWGLGLSRAAAILAVALGMMVWWNYPSRAGLLDGNLDSLLAAIVAPAYCCLLTRFDRSPGVGCWVALLLTCTVGWFAGPLLFLLFFPIFLIYYLSVGVKHQFGWHLALAASLVGALAANAFWLIDWIRLWWVRVPLQLQSEALHHRTIQTVWSASLWGDDADRALVLMLLVLTLVGSSVLNQSGQRPAARLLGLGILAFLVLSILGILLPPLGRLGTSQLYLPAIWFMLTPAAYALARIISGLRSVLGCPWRCLALCALWLAATIYLGRPFVATWLQRALTSEPFVLGLNQSRADLVEVIRRHTGPEARILWEERGDSTNAPYWTALLPVLTERAYLGGLVGDRCIEHSYVCLQDQSLANRALTGWNNADLDEFCRRYNIGWAVCWSPDVVSRFRAWRGDANCIPLNDDRQGFLFVLPLRSYFLKGQGRWISATRQRIVLADVIPEDGKIVLSLHYQSGLMASPNRVQIEREPDPFDPIPFIRLRVPDPVAVLTLTWDER